MTEGKTLWIDVSLWNIPAKMDYDLMKSEGVMGVIIRAGGSLRTDPHLAAHVASVRTAGLLMGMYYWIDPLYDGKRQAEHFLDLAKQYLPDLVAGDVEQWWADWNKWHGLRQGKVDADDVPRLSSRQINLVSWNFMTTVKQGYEKPAFVYTSRNFVNQWCPELLIWINQFSVWLAQWPPTGGSLAQVNTDWKDLQQNYLPTTRPTPLGTEPPLLWQWSGERFKLPGHNGYADLNWHMGDPTSLPNLPDPVPLAYAIHRLGPGTFALNVREQPNAESGSRVLRIIQPGEDIYVDPTIGTPPVSPPWVKLYGEEGYINSKFTVRIK